MLRSAISPPPTSTSLLLKHRHRECFWSGNNRISDLNVPVEVWTIGFQLMHSLWPEGERAKPEGPWGEGIVCPDLAILNPQVGAFISPKVPIMILHSPFFFLWANPTAWWGCSYNSLQRTMLRFSPKVSYITKCVDKLDKRKLNSSQTFHR